MGDLQDVYAKHLLKRQVIHGYPLWTPEPMSTLPEYYREHGLQVGDVGTVDSDGQFDVLFNICKHGDNALHIDGVPERFQPIELGPTKFTSNAIAAQPICSHDILQDIQARTATGDYEFSTSARAGAILILPQGANSVKLRSPEQFRKVAMESALDWYEFAKKRYDVCDRSLYLITGLYKTRSWSLGTFNNPKGIEGKILARKESKDPDVYPMEFMFPDNSHHSGGGASEDFNQTVFITGFKIMVDSQLPEVMDATRSEITWSMLFRRWMARFGRILGFSSAHKPPPAIDIEHKPPLLSQPFHPSDFINRFLLRKNSNERVAIMHDDQWMDMMKDGLTHEDLLQEDRLGTFLTQYYDISVGSKQENGVVYLERKADGAMGSVTGDPHGLSPELEISDPSASELEVSSSISAESDISSITQDFGEPSLPTSDLVPSAPFTSSLNNPRVVITRIRAQNIPLGRKRIPIGLYVLIEFDNIRRRTQNKTVKLNDTDIEWDNLIFLPSQASGKVRFTVYASFELKPMLGDGEALYTSDLRLEELVGGTHLIMFSPGGPGATTSGASLFVTLGRWYSTPLAVTLNGNDDNLELEESELDLVRETKLGQEALVRYHNEYQREDLESAVRHFECARQCCPSGHPCSAAVFVNLARAKFISHQVDPASADLEELIGLYHLALDLRLPDHPDRPVTLLQLAQAQLFHYEKQDCDASVEVKINGLMEELRGLGLPENTHERRAADLVRDTLKRYKVVNSGSEAELDELVGVLRSNMMVSSGGYFDRPQRMINLRSALWKRYETHSDDSDLASFLETNEQILQLLPGRHPDRLPCLKALGNALRKLLETSEGLDHVKKLITLSEEALQLTTEGHPERSYWISNSATHLAEESERLGDTASEISEATVKYSRAIVAWSHLVTPQL